MCNSLRKEAVLETKIVEKYLFLKNVQKPVVIRLLPYLPFLMLP